MLPSVLYFDLYIFGKVTKNFYCDRILVKSVAFTKNGPPLYFPEDCRPIKNHPYVEKFVKENKVKFQKFHRLSVKFEPIEKAKAYFNERSKTLQFKSKNLGQNASNSSSSQVSSFQGSQTRSQAKKASSPSASTSASTPATPKKRKSVNFRFEPKKSRFSPLEEEKKASVSSKAAPKGVHY